MNKETNHDGVSYEDITKGKMDFVNELAKGAKKQTIRQWTKEQLDIFAWFTGSLLMQFQHLVIWALPGTGKTSTCIESIIRYCALYPTKKVVYLAFMSRNAVDARGKIPAALIASGQVRIETCNAIGNQTLNKRYKFVRISPKYTKFTEWNRAKKICPELKDKDRQSFVRLIAKLVSCAKNAHIGVPTESYLVKLAATRAISPSAKESALGWNVERLADISRQVMELSLTDSWRSYDDQIWQCLTKDLVQGEFDMAILDELQDFNPLNYELGKLLIKPDGRICGPGDNNQSMYTFRGAVPNGMQAFAKEIGAGSLTLSCTFRVPKSGVADIADRLTGYVAHESNREGVLIKDMTIETMTSEACIGCAILSRTNAPLMPLHFEFIRKGKPSRIEGKEIGHNLVDIIDQIGTEDINSFEDSLGIWEQTRIAKAGTGFSSTRTVELVTDQAATLRVLCEACDSVASMKQKIKDLFQDTSDNPLPAIVLSTVHKAKGLEWESVYILRDTFTNSRKPSNETEQAEEEHIDTVSRTRHWNKLAHVTGKLKAPTSKLVPLKPLTP